MIEEEVKEQQIEHASTELIKAEQPSEPLKFFIKDPTTFRMQANDSVVILHDSEISIYFGNDARVNIDGVEMVKAPVSVTMTHLIFMQLMDFWMTRYLFLSEVYGKYPESIQTYAERDKARVDVAYDKWITNKGKDVE